MAHWINEASKTEPCKFAKDGTTCTVHGGQMYQTGPDKGLCSNSPAELREKRRTEGKARKESISESEMLDGWVKVPVDMSAEEHKHRQADAYRAMGLSPEEAKLASEL